MIKVISVKSLILKSIDLQPLSPANFGPIYSIIRVIFLKAEIQIYWLSWSSFSRIFAYQILLYREPVSMKYLFWVNAADASSASPCLLLSGLCPCNLQTIFSHIGDLESGNCTDKKRKSKWAIGWFLQIFPIQHINVGKIISFGKVQTLYLCNL